MYFVIKLYYILVNTLSYIITPDNIIYFKVQGPNCGEVQISAQPGARRNAVLITARHP